MNIIFAVIIIGWFLIGIAGSKATWQQFEAARNYSMPHWVKYCWLTIGMVTGIVEFVSAIEKEIENG